MIAQKQMFLTSYEKEVEFRAMLTHFSIALLSAAFGAAAGGYFHWLSEKKKSHEEILLQIYMLLIELNGALFWIASRQVRGEDPNPEHAKKFSDLSWRIADLLRQFDKLPETPEILTVMFSLRFRSEVQRTEEIDRLLKQLGRRVNPRYDSAMKQISDESRKLMADDVEEFLRRQKRIQP
ncbi:MAG TPA: hypothetical protein VOA41_11410 [Candidatus Dormibacteraeota bacterium]|nr:hypothetical protein [Candidatus Dormibacteraeota bacterium]